ncbi:hypothetical protein BKA62DRAFT_786886 [Auriculariales sp. MPI-PUGE-AT-0066]|nr:hypothetical protein BKA62DRAFT_786886 [Auriculariales sp. MPI-PUGE-AT-0066]
MASFSDAIVASSGGPSHAAAPSLGSQQSQHSQKLSSESVRSAAHSVTAMSVTSSASAPVLNAPAPSHAHPQPGWLNIDPRATGSSSPAPSSVRTGSRSAPSSPTRGFSALPHPGPAQVNQPATPKSSHATGHQAMSRAPPSGHDHAEGGVASADRDMLARLNDLRRNLAALGTALDAMPHGKERAILEKEYANLHKLIARESSRTSPTSPNSPSKNKGKDKARFSMSIRALFQGNPETRVQKAERALAGAVGRAEANGVKGSDRDSRRQRTQSAGAQMHRAALKHSVSHGQLRPPQSPFQRHPLSPQRQPPPQGPNNFYQHPARSVGTPGPGDHPFSVAPGQGSMRQRTQSEFGDHLLLHSRNMGRHRQDPVTSSVKPAPENAPATPAVPASSSLSPSTTSVAPTCTPTCTPATTSSATSPDGHAVKPSLRSASQWTTKHPSEPKPQLPLAQPALFSRPHTDIPVATATSPADADDP